MGKMKREIRKLISDGKYQEACLMIGRYEKEIPYDSEIYLLKSLCSLGLGDMGQALQEARLAVKNMPYVADVRYNYATAWKQSGCTFLYII